MYFNDKKIPENEVANCFASFFAKKVDNIVVSIEFFPLLRLNSTMETTDKILCET